MNKKIKLYFLLIFASMSTIAHPGIGTWMQEKFVRGASYLWDFLPTENTYVKTGVLIAAEIALLAGWHSSALKARAQSKERKDKIENYFKYHLKAAQLTDLSAALIMPSIGFKTYRCMRNNENNVKNFFATYKCDSGIAIDSRFNAAQKQEIESVLSASGLQKAQVGVEPIEGGMKSAYAAGTSQRSIIGISADFDPHNKEHRFVLGHEAVHIKNDHPKKRAIAACVIPVAVHAGCALLHYGTSKIVNTIKRAYTLKKGSWGYSICSWIKNGTKTLSQSWILKGLLSFYLWKKYVRMQEKEADIESAQMLNTAQGGVDFFKNLQSENLKTRGSFMSCIDNQGNNLCDIEHPLFSERIAYLTPLAEQQAQTAK